MRIVIDISEEEYIRICDEPCTELALAVRNGTVFPDNPTNGDMIKALFPLSDYFEMEQIKEVKYVTVWFHNSKVSHDFAWDWWIAPFEW